MRSLVIFFAVLGVCWAGAQVPGGGLHVEPVQSVDSQIFGGTSAFVGEFPSLLSLQVNGVHHCGAVLLEAYYGLTSAKCVINQTATSMRVVAGQYNRNDYTSTQIASIANYNRHELYDPGTGVSEVDDANDIAVLRFSTPITEVGGRIAYATLPVDSSNTFANVGCVIAGWGSIDSTSNYPITLQRASIPAISDPECKLYLGELQVWFDQICARDPSNYRGACDGDFGGPLLCPDTLQGGVVVVAGIGSWVTKTSGICDPSFPSVYTRVSSYLGWIGLNTP